MEWLTDLEKINVVYETTYSHVYVHCVYELPANVS